MVFDTQHLAVNIEEQGNRRPVRCVLARAGNLIAVLLQDGGPGKLIRPVDGQGIHVRYFLRVGHGLLGRGNCFMLQLADGRGNVRQAVIFPASYAGILVFAAGKADGVCQVFPLLLLRDDVRQYGCTIVFRLQVKGDGQLAHLHVPAQQLDGGGAGEAQKTALVIQQRGQAEAFKGQAPGTVQDALRHGVVILNGSVSVHGHVMIQHGEIPPGCLLEEQIQQGIYQGRKIPHVPFQGNPQVFALRSGGDAVRHLPVQQGRRVLPQIHQREGGDGGAQRGALRHVQDILVMIFAQIGLDGIAFAVQIHHSVSVFPDGAVQPWRFQIDLLIAAGALLGIEADGVLEELFVQIEIRLTGGCKVFFLRQQGLSGLIQPEKRIVGADLSVRGGRRGARRQAEDRQKRQRADDSLFHAASPQMHFF